MTKSTFLALLLTGSALVAQAPSAKDAKAGTAKVKSEAAKDKAGAAKDKAEAAKIKAEAAKDKAAAKTAPAAAAASALVGNKDSKTFHRADCKTAARMKAEHKTALASAAEAQKAGFTACKVCKP